MAGDQDPNRAHPRTAQQLVETEVAAALYLTLLASGASGPPDALEWEELTAGGQELTVLPADDKDLVKAARAHVSARPAPQHLFVIELRLAVARLA